MMMSLEQKKMKFKSSIALNHGNYLSDYLQN